MWKKIMLSWLQASKKSSAFGHRLTPFIHPWFEPVTIVRSIDNEGGIPENLDIFKDRSWLYYAILKELHDYNLLVPYLLAQLRALEREVHKRWQAQTVQKAEASVQCDEARFTYSQQDVAIQCDIPPAAVNISVVHDFRTCHFYSQEVQTERICAFQDVGTQSSNEVKISSQSTQTEHQEVNNHGCHLVTTTLFVNTKSITTDNSIGCPSIEDKADVIDSFDVCPSAGQNVLPDLLQRNTSEQSSLLLKRRISKIPVYVCPAVASTGAVMQPELLTGTSLQSNLEKDHSRSMYQSTSMRKLAGFERNMCGKEVNNKNTCIKKQDRSFPSEFGKVCLKIISTYLREKPWWDIKKTVPSRRLQRELFTFLGNEMKISAISTIVESILQFKNKDVLAYILSLQNYEGNTPLHLAILGKHFDVISLLLASCPLAVDIQNQTSKTPLMLAVEGKCRKAIQKRLQGTKLNLGFGA